MSLLAKFFLERSQPAALGWCWHVDAPCPGSALAAAPNLKDLLQGSGFGSVRFGAVAVSGRGGCSWEEGMGALGMLQGRIRKEGWVLQGREEC